MDRLGDDRELPTGLPHDRAHVRRVRPAGLQALPHGPHVGLRAGGRDRRDHLRSHPDDPNPRGTDSIGELAVPVHHHEHESAGIHVLDLVRLHHALHCAPDHHVRVFCTDQQPAAPALAPHGPSAQRTFAGFSPRLEGLVLVHLLREGATGVGHSAHAGDAAVRRLLPGGNRLHVLLLRGQHSRTAHLCTCLLRTSCAFLQAKSHTIHSRTCMELLCVLFEDTLLSAETPALDLL